MGRVIFLLEEQSMQVLLEGVLPRLFPNLNFQCLAHRGKYDLDQNIVNILRTWREPDARFVIVRDNDNGNCLALKKRLHQLCQRGGRNDTLIRIVCQELEAWYLGEPNAMSDAFGDESLRHIGNRAKYRKNPETLKKPSEDIKSLAPGIGKVDAARRMAEHLTREGNRSHSFGVFLDGVAALAA